MKTPGVHVTVTTEVGYCPFCQRSRTLRREERQLGGLVRTNVECETCHRTISSTIGPPKPKVEEAAAVEQAAPAEADAAAQPAPAPEPKPKPKPKSAPKAAVKKTAPRKTAATRRPRS